MTERMDFQVVSDELRGLSLFGGRGNASPMTIALREGKTIFWPLNGRTAKQVAGRLSSRATASHLSSHTRSTIIDGIPGIVAWWTPKDGAE